MIAFLMTYGISLMYEVTSCANTFPFAIFDTSYGKYDTGPIFRCIWDILLTSAIAVLYFQAFAGNLRGMNSH